MWHTQVPLHEPWRAAIERGPEGWDPAGVARVKLGDAGEAVLWQLADPMRVASPTTTPSKAVGLASARVWMPPALGPAWEATLVATKPDGTNAGVERPLRTGNPFGFYQGYVPASLDDLQRVELIVTRYNHTVLFREVSLYGNAKTNATVTERK